MVDLTTVALKALADVPETSKGDLSADTGQFVNFFFYLIVFAFVIGLLFLVLKLLKKQAGFFTKGNFFTLIDSIVLSKETSIHLVELGGKIMVIGTGKEVSLLTILEDPEIINEITKERMKQDRDENIYGGIKDKLLERLSVLRGRSRQDSIDTQEFNLGDSSDSEFEQELKEQLEKLKRLDKEGRGGSGDE